ncbi:hypothetical protein [Mucilaginibacter sp. UR6-11]|uniref:hypothetical protein n=1 Tax=Mucilaginibacter sp. UR6-11 TaxID=1435644 RepID=UPI001E395784|nr:hypothetical protein [Mucilaginibacter sp. UR6-11]MCC8425119.1 hypothetical protein [Mucilaginibacter sp. UR6-11]
MSRFTKFAFACLLLVASAGEASFAQTALDNPFAIFHGAKPKGKVDSVLIYRYPYEGAETFLYIYNRKGKLIQANLYRYWVNPDFGTTNRDTLKTVYTYNKDGKLISSTPGKTVYQYLASKYGYSIRTGSYDSTKVFEMRFNKLGQMIESGLYKQNDLQHLPARGYHYQYDKQGKLISQTTYFESGLSIITSYRYDNNGNEIESRSTGREHPRVRSYKYSNYDRNHNWTQQAIDFVSGKDDDSIHHQDTIRRRITYYK